MKEVINKIKPFAGFIGLGGAVLLFIGLFLPFVSVSFTVFGTTVSESATYMDSGAKGVVVLLAALAIVALVLLKQNKIAFIPAGLAVILIAIDFIDVLNTNSASLGIGFYVMLLGLIGTIVYAVIFDAKADKFPFYGNIEKLLNTNK